MSNIYSNQLLYGTRAEEKVQWERLEVECVEKGYNYGASTIVQIFGSPAAYKNLALVAWVETPDGTRMKMGEFGFTVMETGYNPVELLSGQDRQAGQEALERLEEAIYAADWIYGGTYGPFWFSRYYRRKYNPGRYNPELMRGMKKEPSSYDWCEKGNKLFAAKRYEDALFAFEYSLQVDPRFFLSWFNKGAALCHLGCYQDALEAYECALQLKPKHRETQERIHSIREWLNRN